MNLFRQILLVTIFIFLILSYILFYCTFSIIKEYAKISLYENAQNSATSLSLAITNIGVNDSSIKTVIKAGFENGNYEKIIFLDLQGNLVYQLNKNLVIDNIPKWFISLVNIDEIFASSTVSQGWKVLGSIEVYADSSIFYLDAYILFKQIIFSLLLSLSILLCVLFFLTKFAFKPLKQISNQIYSVTKNEFILFKNIPFTSEFKSIVSYTNNMIKKIKFKYSIVGNMLTLNKELLYTDLNTSLYNKKYFKLTASNYLNNYSAYCNGFVVVISLKLDDLNIQYGFIEVNKILENISLYLKNEFEIKSNIVSRFYGSKFVILCPNIDEIEVKKYLLNVFDYSKKTREVRNKINFSLFRYSHEDNLETLLNKIFDSIFNSKSIDDNLFNNKQFDVQKSKNKLEINLNNIIKEKYFKLVYKDIINLKTNQVVFSTVYFEIIYENEIIEYKKLIEQIVQQDKLFEVYLSFIQDVLSSSNNNIVSIQLPKLFTDEIHRVNDLQVLLVKYKHRNKYLIFEVEEKIFSKKTDTINLYVQLFNKYNFKFALYDFIANCDDYFYVKELKPAYIKTSKYFLLNLKQNLDAIKILTQSSNIKIIATSIDDNIEVSKLEEIGIDYISK